MASTEYRIFKTYLHVANKEITKGTLYGAVIAGKLRVEGAEEILRWPNDVGVVSHVGYRSHDGADDIRIFP